MHRNRCKVDGEVGNKKKKCVIYQDIEEMFNKTTQKKVNNESEKKNYKEGMVLKVVHIKNAEPPARHKRPWPRAENFCGAEKC